ncbi:MAG: response regulator [Deltaproteobacteria bacterium]|nr:response regulator [Deltaproteobacteria bacterium]
MMLDKLTALVVDDDPVSQQVLDGLLRRFGFETVICSNGKTAFEILTHEHEVIDIVFTDIVMPDMDGKELLHLMRSNVSLRDIPVVLVSAVLDSKELEELCVKFDQALTKCLSKPIKPSEVDLILRQFDLR